MRRDARRGSVLVHVLMMGLLLAVMAALLMKMALHRNTLGAAVAASVQGGLSAEGAAAVVADYWSQAPVCSYANASFSCAGSAGSCRCVCRMTGALSGVTVTASGPPGDCRLTVCAPENGGTCP